MRSMIPAQAAALVREGDVVFLAASCGEPAAVLDAVAAEPDLWRGVTLVGAFLPGINERDYAALGRDTTVRTIFSTDSLRRTAEPGRVRHMPIAYSELWHRIGQRGAIDVAFFQVTRSRGDGTVGLGVSGDFAPALLPTGARLVGLVNPVMPDPPDAPRIPADRFEALVDVDTPLIEYDAGPADAATMEIGRRVAGLLEDGDRLQLGLGKVQAAVFDALDGRARIGFYGGMISSPIRGHLERGTFQLGVTTGVALGDASFYRALGAMADVAYRPVGDTHGGDALAAVDRLVSVNSVLEVDLFGQANAEMLGTRQISGQGGFVDFVRGARRSPGGRSILALPSTAARGKLSRIVPALLPGVPATVARADADIVVTEYGVAHLREADVEERAHRLIAIAHPDFRDALARAWRSGDFAERAAAP
ncbi:acetyl-CoA hydrolase/transferase family protein [Neoaquamicrobium sediminum]|uniref:acetyl-CoA hydrolase/transferase family protein n=1 Tax=Neoaquamicrobium sediminum TaxID=1849104 RepID=UPI003BABE07E